MEQSPRESSSKQSPRSSALNAAFSFLSSEPRDVVSISQDADLQEAAVLMENHRIGDVIVTDENDVPVGILTDRDIALRATAESLDRLSIGDLMRTSLKTAPANSDPFEMARLMRENGISRLPLVDDEGRLVTVVTARKLIQCFLRGLNDVVALGDQQRQNEGRSH